MTERNEWTLAITGMTCDHCARTIDQALRQVPGVIESTTRFAEGRARVVADAPVDAARLNSVIAGAGYKVVGASSRPLRVARGGASDALDLAVVGGGSAGFAAAIRAADLGATAAIIEGGTLGGTCVNVGCVPSKTLIRAAEVRHRAGHHAFAGIRARVEPPDFAAAVAQKDELVTALRQAKYGDVLAAYPQVRLIKGRARFQAEGTLEVDGRPLRARTVVLAIGAAPWAAPIPGLDQVWAGSMASIHLSPTWPRSSSSGGTGPAARRGRAAGSPRRRAGPRS